MKQKLIGIFTLLSMAMNCAKPKPEIMPCDEDLGHLSRKGHLANVRFLDENRSIDWFELYENLEERRNNTAPTKCIPGAHVRTIEQAIERREYELGHLR